MTPSFSNSQWDNGTVFATFQSLIKTKLLLSSSQSEMKHQQVPNPQCILG